MKTIEEVLKQLDEIIARAKENQSLAGYFACTYRIMTLKPGMPTQKGEDAPIPGTSLSKQLKTKTC